MDIWFADELRMFLPPRQRAGPVRAACDGTSTVGHVVESCGVPLPEVGRLLVNGRPVAPAFRPRPGDVVEVAPVPRPQGLPAARFVLDVHLGALARRMRLVGLDATYPANYDDDCLIEQANTNRRVLLTQDRALLRRRKLWLGCYVRGTLPDEQLRDVLERFVPPLAPWTRCTACNGPLVPVAKDDVERMLKPGTRRSYRVFSRCAQCGRVYWRGAHGKRLEAIVDAARQAVGGADRCDNPATRG